MSGAGQVNINGHDNTLQIKNVAYNDSGHKHLRKSSEDGETYR